MTIAPLPLQHGHASVLGDPRHLGVLPLVLILRDPSRLPALIVAPSSAHRRALRRSSSRPPALIIALFPRDQPASACAAALHRIPPCRRLPSVLLPSSSSTPPDPPAPAPENTRGSDDSVSNLRCHRRRVTVPSTAA